MTTNSMLTSAAPADGKIKAALIAYQPEDALNFSQFTQKISALVHSAADQGADLVMFPELMVQDLVNHQAGELSFGRQVRALAEHWPEFLQVQQRLAKQLGIYLFSGTFPRRVQDRIHNTGALIFPNGQTWLQDKLFLTPFEKIWGLTPGNELQPVPTPWGMWTTLICYDCEIPHLSNLLAQLQPTLILVPSMTGAIAGFHRVRWTAQARAIEHKAFVLHTGMVGGPESWPNYGRCAALSPYDDVLSGVVGESPLNVAGVFVMDLDFDLLKKSRASNSVYPARDQNLKAQNSPIRLQTVDIVAATERGRD